MQDFEGYEADVEGVSGWQRGCDYRRVNGVKVRTVMASVLVPEASSVDVYSLDMPPASGKFRLIDRQRKLSDDIVQ